MKEITIPKSEQAAPKKKPRPSTPKRERREEKSRPSRLPYPQQGPPKDKPKPGNPNKDTL